MKIKKHLNTKRIIVIIAGIIILGGAAYGLYLYMHHSSPQSTSTGSNSKQPGTYTPPTKAQVQAGDNQKQQVLNNDQSTQAKPASVQVAITAADQNGSTLNIRSLIQYVTDTGSCTLTLTNSQSVVTKTSSIQALANASTCEGFDIPVSQLITGTWHIKIDVVSGELTGTATGSVQIK